MRIRPAAASEAARLSEIAWLAKAWWGYTPAQMAPWRDELAIGAQSLASFPTLVAQTHAGVIGFCQLDMSGAQAQLTHLWVDPAAMRQGAGRALLAAAASAARAKSYSFLTIDADPGAEVFYHACGARTVAHLPAPIVGEPARVRPQMVLPLDRPA